MAQAAEATHSEDAIRIYQGHAERLLNNRRRGNYAVASIYLRKARELHFRLGENARWSRYLANLRERHGSLCGLREELDGVGI